MDNILDFDENNLQNTAELLALLKGGTLLTKRWD